tara:strand:+ start:185 stop:454 length:270 start_codon:yes stop_codon:yes gene_type:complete
LDRNISKNILSLTPRTFEYKASNQPDIGFIAEEVAEVYELFATYENNEPKNINWFAILASLVSETKRMNHRINVLVAEVKRLKLSQNNK